MDVFRNETSREVKERGIFRIGIRVGKSSVLSERPVGRARGE